ERAELANTYGLACFETGDTARARVSWQQALAVDRGHRGALLNLAALCAGRGDFQEARALTGRVLADTPGDPLALYHFARIERALGNDAGASGAWQSLVAAEPAFADSVAKRNGAP